jgi:hypothetical protein
MATIAHHNAAPARTALRTPRVASCSANFADDWDVADEVGMTDLRSSADEASVIPDAI